MSFVTRKVKKSNKLEEGDHIYVFRPGVIYSHHGIYVGNGMVVHFGVDKIKTNTSSSFSTSSKGSRVLMTCLNCFKNGGSLRRYRYGVNSWFKRMTLIGCSKYKSDPPQEVKKRAMDLLRKGFGKYRLRKNNCEVFAIYCKTGGRNIQNHSCGQASFTAMVSSAVRIVVGSIPSLMINALAPPYQGTCSCAELEPGTALLSNPYCIDSDSDTDSSDSISFL